MRFRHLKSRVLVSVVGGPFVIACVLIGQMPFLILISLVAIFSLREFYQLAQKKEAYPHSIFSIIAALLFIWDMYFYWGEHFQIILPLYVVVISIVQLWQTKGSQIVNLSINLWGVVFVGILISFFVGIRQLPLQFGIDYDKGGFWTLTILMIIWIGDSVAYFVGSSIGKHKLAGRISPKKTIEGAVAGFVSMMMVAVAGKYIFSLKWSLFDALIIGFICGTFGQMSDLVESLFKRDAGVKDSSDLLPGHGGIFDRFDVLFITPPILFFYLRYCSSLTY